LAPDRALLADARRGRRCCRIFSGLRRAVGESRPSRSWSSGASSPQPPRTPCRRRAPPPSRFRLEPPLETGATAYSNMAFQIWTSSVSSRRAPLSMCHGTRAPCAVDEDGDEWWERERGRRPEQGGAYLVEEPDLVHRSPW
jgi:hypothetical protein